MSVKAYNTAGYSSATRKTFKTLNDAIVKKSEITSPTDNQHIAAGSYPL